MEHPRVLSSRPVRTPAATATSEDPSSRCSRGSSTTAMWTWRGQHPPSARDGLHLRLCFPPRVSPPTLLASDGGGDLRAGLRLRLAAPLPRRPMATEVFERLVANGYAALAPAPSPPPPPRWAASPPAVASHGHGGADLQDVLGLRAAAPLPRLLEWSPPPLPGCDAPPLTLVASGGHGGEELLRLREWLVANICVDVASAATGVGARAPAPLLRRDALQPAVRTIDIDQIRASCLLLLISQKDVVEALYPQGQSVFHQHHPRIQELDVDGKEFDAHEEGDLSDVLAPFITQSKFSAQPSLLLSDIGPKSCTTTDISARDFDHASDAQWIGSCTSAPLFGSITDYLLHHEDEVRQLKPESEEDHVTNLKAEKNIGGKCEKKTSEDNAPEPSPAPNSDTEAAGGFQGENLMEKFNKMLVDCVFFALPQVLIFFPRYQASEQKQEQPEQKPEQRLSLMAVIQHTDNQSTEKAFVMFFFVMFVSVWLLGLVLSLFGRGRRCTEAVSMLTLWTVGSTVAFTDYILCKCLPETALFTWLFRGHFVAMFVGIAYIWFTYVGVPKFPSLQLPSCQGIFARFRRCRQNPAPVVDDAKAKDELKQPLLPL